MPAPGDQYQSDNIKNPFNERTISNFTAQEIATLQSRLNRQLGPEYISHRQGAGGSKVAYLEGTKAIALANDVFGFNGWSSSLQQVQIDYVDEAQNGRISLGLSIIVRVTLKDGTYHEDIGYGTIENCKGKGAAFEKAKKEAATDGLKRALRSFGNVLGNCLYDKEYLKKVGTMKVKPIKFDEGRLHRHPDFAPPPSVKEEYVMVKREEHKTPIQTNQTVKAESRQSGLSGVIEPEDEFGGNLFDGVEISEHQDKDSMFDSVSNQPPPKPLEGPRTAGVPSVPVSHRTATNSNNGPVQPPMPRVQSMPAARPPNGGNQPAQQKRPQNQGTPWPAAQPNSRAPQTPNPHQTNARPDMQRPRQPTADIHAPPMAPVQPQQQHNQPLRPPPPQAQQANPTPPNQTAPPNPTEVGHQPTAHRPSVGFVTSRAAGLVQNPDATTVLPAFNPHAESPLPKDQRTPGVDHTRSRKVTRESIGISAPSQPQLQSQQQPQQQQGQPAQGGFRPVGPPRGNSNFVNPHHDANRKIGMPSAHHAMSPLANRGAYKPPGMAGGIKRPPLADVSNQGGNGDGEGPPEAKKPKLDANAGSVENAGGGTVTS